MDHRPSLDPAVAEIRRAVRAALATVTGPVLVGLSGGADSLALADAVAFEAPKAGVAASAAIIDHGLQPDPTASPPARPPSPKSGGWPPG